MRHEYIVFADVDDTLIRYKSMIAFMEYFLYRAPFASSPAAEAKRKEAAALKAMRSPTADRAVLLQRYYEMFRGITREELQQAARRWVLEVMQRGDLFVPSIHREILEHKARNAEIVLVSGSFHEVLDPIGAEVGADHLLCTELEVVDGVYTGAMLQHVIGEGKWEVIRRYLEGRGEVKLEDCYAYGDHLSDLCVLEKVGHPVVVGDSPTLIEMARQRNWRVVPWDA